MSAAIVYLNCPPLAAPLRLRAFARVEAAGAAGTLRHLSLRTGVGLGALYRAFDDGADTLAPADILRLLCIEDERDVA